ncbi:uncharacterized protein B0T15DRAFT_250461 [Chaetomium strumarium]|uniref:Uncharacterized protein n=1 Tax=Chaetomium strumarium TaxID=1170767 RepID=A0AAJ0M0P1_9PEZI|nr:hypothetical protein B0T15DRAFT_250461 [Chaetomium strumarium]
MSQSTQTGLRLSGENESSETSTYSLERYLASDGGLTERLLKGLNVGEIVGRARAVREEVGNIADKIPESQGASSRESS